MNPTIHDVARRANTSKSTVSRFLNGGKVRQPTQLALEEAIRELDYHRNANARNLVMNKTGTIAVVVDSITNNFYSEIIAGIEQVAKFFHYNCIFLSWTSHHHYTNESAFQGMIREGKADGIILVSFRKRQAAELKPLVESGTPVVLIGDNDGLASLLTVDVDNSAGTAEGVRYLHRIGHQRIAYISGPIHAAATIPRLRGYTDTIGALGLTLRTEWIVESDWTNEGGYAATVRLLQEGGFTAIVASNDETAIGALRAMQERGYSVPRDYSIVGFDDISIASWVYPPLTTVRQPFREIGIQAAEALLGILSPEASVMCKEPMKQPVLLKPRLIVRDSCEKK